MTSALNLTYFWGTTGRTPGQHVFGLLWIVVSRRNASLQDLVLRSAVVYDWAHRTGER